jgi:hypothetical protein
MGGTKISGSNRVATTWAATAVSTGRIPRSTRNTSESNEAPSWRARTSWTIPAMRSVPRPGTWVSTITGSSSWR